MIRLTNGIWPTMITPFTNQNEIDEKALAEQINWYVVNGCDGLFAVCQSSEMFQLSLEERTLLAKLTVEYSAGRLPVIASGNIADTYKDQIEEIEAIWQTGVQAVVLLSNRLATAQQSDDVWITNASRLLDRFPEVTFGMYECPYPYKRLISDKTLTWMAQSARFSFIKDTCCNAQTIKHRLEMISLNTPAECEPMSLYNANTLTLLETLKYGAAGFCGVMGNFHPDIYKWLYKNYLSKQQLAEEVQAALSLMSSVEGQAYPVCAKWHMQQEGIPFTLETRTVKSDAFGYVQKETLRQLRELECVVRTKSCL